MAKKTSPTVSLADVPPTLRRFALQSRAVSVATVSRCTGVPKDRIFGFRWGKFAPTDDENRRLALFFGMSEQKMRDALSLVIKLNAVRARGELPDPALIERRARPSTRGTRRVPAESASPPHSTP